MRTSDCEPTLRIGSASARLDSAQRFFPPPATLRRNILWVRLAPVLPLMTAEFLRSGPCRRVQFPIALSPTRAALIVLLNRFRSADESGLEVTPNRANHENSATLCILHFVLLPLPQQSPYLSTLERCLMLHNSFSVFRRIIVRRINAE